MHRKVFLKIFVSNGCACTVFVKYCANLFSFQTLFEIENPTVVFRYVQPDDNPDNVKTKTEEKTQAKDEKTPQKKPEGKAKADQGAGGWRENFI